MSVSVARPTPGVAAPQSLGVRPAGEIVGRLACPSCDGPLTPVTDGVSCPSESRTYRIEAGVLGLLPPSWGGGGGIPLPDLGRAWAGGARPRTLAEAAALPAPPRGRRGAIAWLARAAAARTLLEAWSGPGTWVLDLGAGCGWLSRLLRAAGHRPLAVDLLVDAPLGVATLPALGHGFEDIPAVQADMEDLPFARGGFQRAVSFGSFPYVRDAPCWLRRLHDVLAPGGELALPMTPVHRGRDAAERAGASRSASLARARTRATYHHFTQDGLCSLLEAAGFRPRFEEPDYPRLFRLVRSAKRSVLGDGAAGFPLILAKRVP